MKRGLISASIVSGIILGILFLPLVNAQYWYGGMLSPENWLDNPWFVFVTLFAIFFATIYFSLGKVFRGDPAVPLIIAAALSFAISAGIQRNWSFLQQPIMFWAVILAITLVIVTFFRAMSLGPWGTTALVLIILGSWSFIKNSLSVNALSVLPYWLVDFLDSISGFMVIVFVAGAVMILIIVLKNLFGKRR